jgi:hypothetical protein
VCGRTRHVELAHRSTLCFLACTLSGQRHQRRQTIVEGSPKGQKPGRTFIHLFRIAASSLHHRLTPLGNQLRRMKAKLGPEAATMATAHKIAVIFYSMVKNQVEHDETIWDARDAQ